MMNYLKPEDVRLLLGRDEVLGDTTEALDLLANCSVLVTGAGTLGTAICYHLAGKIRELHCCDHSEVGIHNLTQEMPEVQGHLCSVTSKAQVEGLLLATSPDVVIHTAAHKHVGQIEAMPRAGVQNNVGGLVTLMQGAASAGTERLLLISSDKAVAPSCVYGATKHICERLAYGWGANALRLVNLLGSSGSVLPIFWERMANGLPLMVTHPEVERHFITVREAAVAAIQAAAQPRGARLLTTPICPPVRIADLAERAGRWTGSPARVEFASLSPVEKLVEMPLYADETMEDAGGLLSCSNPHPAPLGIDDAAYDALEKAAAGDVECGRLEAALRALVPDYLEATP